MKNYEIRILLNKTLWCFFSSIIFTHVSRLRKLREIISFDSIKRNCLWNDF